MQGELLAETNIKCEPEDQDQVVVMPEGPRSAGHSPLSAMEHKLSSRKNSNLSTCSDDSLRKISNDSGISIASASLHGLASAGAASMASPASFDDLIGEPRLSNAAMQSMLAQQALSSQLSNMNPAAMIGMSQAASAAYASLWSNPLAAVLLQQQEATRKLLESASNGRATVAGSSSPNNGKQYPKEPCPVYPGFPNLVQPSSQAGENSTPLAEVVKYQEQLLHNYKSQLLSKKQEEAVRPTRKAHSYSGLCSGSPLMHRQVSPHTVKTGSPNSTKYSPNYTGRNGSGVDEQLSTGYGGDDDSVCSNQSARSKTPPPTTSSALNVSPTPTVYSSHAINPQHVQSATNSRKRKNGFIASLPMSDVGPFSGTQASAFSAAAGQLPSAVLPAAGADVPMSKLSTASLPASLPSVGGHTHSPYEANLSGGATSAATSRKRKPVSTEEKDESYWERRRKNNEAAKRSRDSRRAKEDEIAIRAAFLENENLKLRLEMGRMREEIAKLKTELEEARGGRKSAEKNSSSPSSDGENERPNSQQSLEKASLTNSQPPSPVCREAAV